MDGGEAKGMGVFHSGGKALLELLVSRFRAYDQVLRVVQEYTYPDGQSWVRDGRISGRTGGLAEGIANDDSTFHFVRKGFHGLQDGKRYP